MAELKKFLFCRIIAESPDRFAANTNNYSMALNKKNYWQKTAKCSSCHFNDDPDACHYYGYRFWPELPLADDCWQHLSEAQWKELESIPFERKRLERWDQIRHENHPGLTRDYQPEYALHYNVPPEEETQWIREQFFEKDGTFKFKD